MGRRKAGQTAVVITEAERREFVRSELFFKKYHITRRALSVLREKIEIYERLTLEERRYALTDAEKEDYKRLHEVFHNKSSPSVSIAESLREMDNLPLLEAEHKKAQRGYENCTSPELKDSFSKVDFLLILFGAIFLPVGAAVMKQFAMAGIAIIIAGILMYVPLIYSHIEKRRETRENMKKLAKEISEKELRIEEINENLENIKRDYRLSGLSGAELKTQLKCLSALAREYERITAKMEKYSKAAHPDIKAKLAEEIDTLFLEDFGIKVSADDYEDALRHFSEMFEKYSEIAQKMIRLKAVPKDAYIPPKEKERYQIIDSEAEKEEEENADAPLDYQSFCLSAGSVV